jgi:hypothetical protein
VGLLVAFVAAEVWASTGTTYADVCRLNVYPIAQAVQQCESTATTHALAGGGVFVGVALIIIGFIPGKRR